MHEQITKEFGKRNICVSRFGVRIGWRKYLYECTPFGYVNLCIGRERCGGQGYLLCNRFGGVIGSPPPSIGSPPLMNEYNFMCIILNVLGGFYRA